MKKLYDLAVKTGEYQNSAGETKGRWLNVGAIMEKDDGGRMIFLDRTFSPAGIANPDNRSNIILSMFAPKDKTENISETPPPPGDEDIPF